MTSYQGPWFYYQLGHQDHLRCLAMAGAGFGKGAILSPTHLSATRLSEVAADFRASGCDVLFDPQFFDMQNLPRRAAVAPPDLNQTEDLLQRGTRSAIVDYYFRWQQDIDVSWFLTPCPIPNPYTPAWGEMLYQFAEEASEWCVRENAQQSMFMTVIIPEEVIADSRTRRELLNAIVGLDSLKVEGFYIVLDGTTVSVNQPALVGLLDLVFRLKQNRFSTLLGFSDFWAMLAFPFGLDSFAAGSWLKNRVFQSTQWRGNQASGPRRKPKRYRSALLLGDVRFPEEAEFLRDSGLWNTLDNASPYARLLFGTTSPTAVEASGQWPEGSSHKNTFWQFDALAKQFQRCSGRDERIELVRSKLAQATLLHDRIGQQRQLQNDGTYLTVWRSAFEQYLSDTIDELEDEFA